MSNKKKNLQKELQLAILQHSIERVKKSLESGADVEYVYKNRDRNPYTPLILAIEQSNLEIIKLLLTKANVNHVVKKSTFHINSPLAAAFCNDNVNGPDIFKILLKDGVKMHKQVPQSGIGKLHGPCITDDEVMKAATFLCRFLKNGMNQKTFLAHCKALKTIGMDYSNNIKAVRMLMFDLVKQGYTDVIHYILQLSKNIYHVTFFPTLDMKNINRWYHDKSEFVRPGGHLTLLMKAIYYKQHTVMSELLKAGASISQNSVSTAEIPYETPITLAIKVDNDVALDSLLKSHLVTNIINKANQNGETPLLCAVLKGQKNRVKQLLQLGADTNIHDKQRHLPLEIAILKHDMSIAQLLVKNGANLALLTSTKETFSDYNAHNGTEAIGTLLNHAPCAKSHSMN